MPNWLGALTQSSWARLCLLLSLGAAQRSIKCHVSNNKSIHNLFKSLLLHSYSVMKRGIMKLYKMLHFTTGCAAFITTWLCLPCAFRLTGASTLQLALAAVWLAMPQIHQCLPTRAASAVSRTRATFAEAASLALVMRGHSCVGGACHGQQS